MQNHHYDFIHQFLSKNNYEKKREILRILIEASKRTCEAMELNFDLFNQRFEKLIRETNYEFIEQTGKILKSPDRQWQGSIKRVINTDSLFYFFTARKKAGEIKEIPIVRLNYERVLFPMGSSAFLISGEGMWVDNNLFQISNNSKSIIYNCDLQNNHCEVSLAPDEYFKTGYLTEKYELATTQDTNRKKILVDKLGVALLQEVDDWVQIRIQRALKNKGSAN